PPCLARCPWSVRTSRARAAAQRPAAEACPGVALPSCSPGRAVVAGRYKPQAAASDCQSAQPKFATSHSAVPTLAFAWKTDAPPYPAALDSAGHTPGRNWKTPAAPPYGLTAFGSSLDSWSATHSAWDMRVDPSGA